MIGIQRMDMATSARTKTLRENIYYFLCEILLLYLPTIISSQSCAFFLKRCQISIVKMVELELNIDVNEDINAAIIQANVKPRIARIE